MESERYKEMLKAATHLMDGDEEAAKQWLASPQDLFGGAAPEVHGKSDKGLQEVLQLIGRLEHGVFT